MAKHNENSNEGNRDEHSDDTIEDESDVVEQPIRAQVTERNDMKNDRSAHRALSVDVIESDED